MKTESGPEPKASSARRRAVVAILVVAFVLRAVHLLAIRDTPLFDYPVSDARAYLEWGREIAAGDWAGDSRGVFYQAPLYPYLVGVVLALGGTTTTLRWLQALWGTLACALLALAGRRFFGWREGLLAALVLALFPPAIFFDGLLHKESLANFLMCCLLAALATATAKGSRLWSWFAAGVAAGLLTLVRENALILLPVLVVVACLHPRKQYRGAVALLFGTALALGPVAMRNAAVGGDWALTTSQSGPNFAIGNHPGARGVYAALRPGRSDTPFERMDAEGLAEAAVGRELSPVEVSRYWWGRGLSFWRRHPGEALGLFGRKLLLVFHAYEIPDAEDLYLAREDSPVLYLLVPWLHLGVLVPFAAVGLALAWRRRGTKVILALLGALALGLAMFYLMARYRYPLVPGLILLAATGGVAVVVRWRDGKRRLLGAGLAALLTAVAVNIPVAWLVPVERGMPWVNRGVAHAGLGHLEAAIADYRRALAKSPELFEAHLNLGSTLLISGRPAEALPHLEEAVRLVPDDGDALLHLGVTRAELGRWSQAEEALRRALDRSSTPDIVQRELDRLEAVRTR